MGRKSNNKASTKKDIKKENPGKTLPAKKRNDLSILVDKLLRISTIPTPRTINKSISIQTEIDDILSKIVNIEAGIDIPAGSTGNRSSGAIIKTFTKWMTDNGANFDGLTIEEFDGYELGLKTARDIAEGSLVISVPRKLMMTVEAAKDSLIGPLIERDKMLQNMPNVALAMFLLLEKFSPSSFWKPYIDILPKSYTTVLYFNKDEILELKDSPTLMPALNLILSIVRQYAYFNKLVQTSEDPASELLRNVFTFDQYRHTGRHNSSSKIVRNDSGIKKSKLESDYEPINLITFQLHAHYKSAYERYKGNIYSNLPQWAVSTIMTRQNSVPVEDGSHLTNALIPLWDLCNHTNGNISTEYNPELKTSECLAVKDFKKGEQLFIFYGIRPNADLFIHNGFVFEDNIHDGYWLKLGVSKSDPLYTKKSTLLDKISIPAHGEFWLKPEAEPIPGQLLAFTRAFNMSEEQLDHWLDSDKSIDLLYKDCALETDLENKTWTFLQNRFKLLLSCYKTTLSDDLKQLENKRITACRRLAIRMRVTEKKILQGSLSYVEQRIKN